MEQEETELKGSLLMLNDTSVKRGWRKQKDEETLADDTRCGLGVCRPNSVQCCATMGAFTCICSITSLLTTALQAYFMSQITAIERHFGLSSSISGFLVSCNDIGFLMVTVGISYVVRRLHIPRLLALSTALYGIAGLVCVVPFLITRDQLNSGGESTVVNSTMISTVFQRGALCNNIDSSNSTAPANVSIAEQCERSKFSYVHDPSTRKIVIAIIAIGMIIQGMAKAPRNPGITTYVDDNVPKKKTAMYMGFITGLAICAGALSFGVGGVFSQIFITLEPTSMTPRHPRWVGAWWLGFLVFGIAAIGFSFPLICFPRRMRSRDDNRDVQDKLTGIAGFLTTLIGLVTNPVYFPIIIANCFLVFSIGGGMAFFPKYIETQFNIPSWKANIVLGASAIVTNAAGTIIGGFLTTKLRLSPLTGLKIVIVVVSISMAGQVCSMFLGCSNPYISKGEITVLENSTIDHGGYSTSSGNTTDHSSLCNSECACGDVLYFPMCGADGINYFSPCHAGCTEFNISTYTYDDCLCVSGNKKTATPGLCLFDCYFFYPLIAVSVLSSFIMTMGAMPILIAIIRSVDEADKPAAMGLSGFLTTLLGFLPGPIFFGWVIDKACIHWNYGCGGTGSCALYDIEYFRFLLMGIPVVARVFPVGLYFFAFCMARRPGSRYRKYEEEQATKEEIIPMNPK